MLFKYDLETGSPHSWTTALLHQFVDYFRQQKAIKAQ